jgi:hypothetical protein
VDAMRAGDPVARAQGGGEAGQDILARLELKRPHPGSRRRFSP